MKRNQITSGAAALGAALLTLLGGSAALAQVDGTNWGTITAPVYGTSETLRADGAATAPTAAPSCWPARTRPRN